MHWCTATPNWEKKAKQKQAMIVISPLTGLAVLNVRLNWLCCLLADCPSVPQQSRVEHAWRHCELGGLWHPEIVTAGVALPLLSSRHHIPLLAFVLLSLFSVCLPRRQTHVNTRSTCWDQTCWALCGEYPSRPPSTSLGRTPCMPLDFFTEQPHSSCGVSDDSVLASHLSTGADLRRLCCPNSYSAGGPQREIFCFCSFCISSPPYSILPFPRSSASTSVLITSMSNC